MNTYQLLQDILNTPTKSANYWHTQSTLVKLSRLTQSNISKQLYKLVKNGVVKVELREYAPGKNSKHYCLTTKLDVQETEQHCAYEQFRAGVDILANDLKASKKLTSKQYKTLLIQIQKINAIVKGEQPSSPYERQFNKLRIMFKNLTDQQLEDFTKELLEPDCNRGAITDKYLTLNAQTER